MDVHTHVVPPLPDLGDGYPSFEASGDVARIFVGGRAVRTVPIEAWDLTRRAQELDRRGVERHVVSPLPPLVPQQGDRGGDVAWADALNTSLAALVAPFGDRFPAFGLVPQAHPGALAQEAEHARSIGLRGLLIGTDFDGLGLDDPALHDFFAACAAHGLIVFVHPIATTLDDRVGERITGEAWRFGLGMGTDTAIAAGQLVLGGVLEQHRDLKVLLAHGGGTFFWALSRARRLMTPGELSGLERVLRRVWVDSVVYDPSNLAYLLDAIGPDRIAFGTDYPLPAEDRATVAHLDDLPSVRGATAMHLLDGTGPQG